MLTAMAMTTTKAIGNDDYDTDFNGNVDEDFSVSANKSDANMGDVEGASGGGDGVFDWKCNGNVNGYGDNDDCEN